LRHPFLVNIQYAFQDPSYVYLVSDFMAGGDLRYHLSKRVKFSQEPTRFIVACLVAALQYVHSNCIIHRDIKPENLVFDRNGYVKVTDFGIAKTYQRENSHETSGTPSYMAPEVIFKQNHGFVSDFYAVGVICHELMLDRRPYKGRTRKDIKEQMLHKKVKLKASNCPEGWDVSVIDFLNRCLQRKPCKRLGFNGAQEVMQHPWLRDFDWSSLLSQQMKAPFKPNVMADNFDEDHANHERTLNQSEQEEFDAKQLLLLRESMQQLFSGYYFDYLKEESEHKKSLADRTTCKSTSNQKSLATGPAFTQNQQFSSLCNNLPHSNRQDQSRNLRNTLMKKLLTTDKSAFSALTSQPRTQVSARQSDFPNARRGRRPAQKRASLQANAS